MPTNAELIGKYFVTAADVTGSGIAGTPAPTTALARTFADSKITPLIDADSYNAALRDALDTVGVGATPADNAGDYIFLAKWWLGLAEYAFEEVQKLPDGTEVKTPRTRPGYDINFDNGPARMLLQALIDKAKVGVEVRVLGWASFNVLDDSFAEKYGASIARINGITLTALKALRAEPTIGGRAVANTLAHTAGAVHNKIAIVGNNTRSVAFTGGLDTDRDRFARPRHTNPSELWHDVMAQMEGPAAQAIFDHFQSLYNENVDRPVVTFQFDGGAFPACAQGEFAPGPGVQKLDKIADRALVLPAQPENHQAQSLRTVPAFRYSLLNCVKENTPVSWAADGLFEYRAALRKAIGAATNYIYMEDQSFWSQEILGWINERLKTPAGANLKVILLFSGRGDPNDAPNTNMDAKILSQSINDGLLAGLSVAQRSHVRIFRRLAPHLVPVIQPNPLTGAPEPVALQTTNIVDNGASSDVTFSANMSDAIDADKSPLKGFYLIPAANAGAAPFFDASSAIAWPILGNPAIAAGTPLILRLENRGAPPDPGVYILFRQVGVTVHAKTTLIDDEWAVIGSGNIMRRSLYTDFEHGVAWVDADGTSVRDYRCALFSDHFMHLPATDFETLPDALNAWEPAWGPIGGAPNRPSWLPVIESFPVADLSGTSKIYYDAINDVDSRDNWDGLCALLGGLSNV